jgi:transposase
MNKQVSAPQATVFCWIDVSAASLAVALIAPDGSLARREFSNNASGHEALSVWSKKRDSRVRVSLEATGIYSLDHALALDAEACVERMVLNPRLANRFQQTVCRSKTDSADAMVLAEYSHPYCLAPSLSSEN